MPLVNDLICYNLQIPGTCSVPYNTILSNPILAFADDYMYCIDCVLKKRTNKRFSVIRILTDDNWGMNTCSYCYAYLPVSTASQVTDMARMLQSRVAYVASSPLNSDIAASSALTWLSQRIPSAWIDDVLDVCPVLPRQIAFKMEFVVYNFTFNSSMLEETANGIAAIFKNEMERLRNPGELPPLQSFLLYRKNRLLLQSPVVRSAIKTFIDKVDLIAKHCVDGPALTIEKPSKTLDVVYDFPKYSLAEG